MEYLSTIQHKNQTELFEKFKVGFAFSESQLKELKEKFGESLKVTAIPNINGMVIFYDDLKENIKEKYAKFLDLFDKNYNEAVKIHHERYGFEKVISQAYFNFESQISMDTSEAESSLSAYQEIFPEIYTSEVIKQGFKKCWQHAIDNDCF